jgi:hypothetical protein
MEQEYIRLFSKTLTHICIGFNNLWVLGSIPLFQGYFKMAFACGLDITVVHIS